MSLQNHYSYGSNPRLYVGSANALTKDKAVTGVSVTIDTSQWSVRKKNIIRKSLRSSIAACGYEMAELVDALAQSIGRRVNTIGRNTGTINLDDIKPERRGELLAYTAAWCRLRLANAESVHRHHFGSYWERRFVDHLDKGTPIDHIPLDRAMNFDATRDFVHEYLIASDQPDNDDEVEALIAAIDNGEMITIKYSK